MTTTQEAINFKDFNGIRMLHIATLTTDDATKLEFGTPIRFAGAEEVGNETEEDSTVKFYDNTPSIVNDSEGADTYSINCSVVPDRVRALMDGRPYDETTGAYYGTPKKKAYCAFGFIAEETDGKEYCYWAYKGKFSGGGNVHKTKTEGSDSNGQEYSYSSIYTNHKFTTPKGKQPMKFWKLPLDETTEEAWFASVQTPDTLTPPTEQTSAQSANAPVEENQSEEVQVEENSAEESTVEA